jgi:hypothetical protein
MEMWPDTPAVSLVLAHMRAWANGDLETARGNVAEDVKLIGNDESACGIDAYMDGLRRFVSMFDPNSLQIVAARGDDRQAMIMAEVNVNGRPLPSARIMELDRSGKIAVERVIFFGPPA